MATSFTAKRKAALQNTEKRIFIIACVLNASLSF